ncbi:PLP-dependent transferase [Aaosphaeria arxii CBS 175.79]|uniref:PLP-dependent transferase n=1 Tax=Aaosphaeria arxii CBS 175.79 TaxID=1450172 RepID=A0A6A5XC89_9PLEO|nr:PLP-dependent transferase [Aaosphaeria arxii CBS 175.79]KAF2010394.1 PLP-dependent transferase [Aaosphaeria arxii CBS 175.79]
MASSTLAVRESGPSKFGKELRKDFLFDENWLNLNHGSFGTYPRKIQTILRGFQDEAEARPDKFIRYDYPQYLDESRLAVSKVLNAPVEGVVFVPNATTGVNTVFRNLVFEKGDKILYLDNIYGACEKTIAYITETTPAEAIKMHYELPFEDDSFVEDFKKTIKQEQEKGSKVKIALFDAVVSMPGVRLPFERLTEACRELGVLSCIDAAHGIGHVEIDIEKLDPDFFVSNCHKWLFAPRGCAVFYVPVRNQHLIRSTLPTSHGFIPQLKPGVKIRTPLPVVGVKSLWVSNFQFVGTIDSAPYLCVPESIKYRESIGGEKAIIDYCHNLAKTAAARTAEILGTEVMDNSTRTITDCCLTNVRLPLSLAELEPIAVKAGIEKDDVAGVATAWMHTAFIEDYETFLALIFYNGNWWVRLSAQVYLGLEDFEWAAQKLKEVIERVKKGEFIPSGSKL